MTCRGFCICWSAVALVGTALACMDLDGYHLDGGVSSRGGSGGTAVAPRGGSGACANEVFTLYNNAVDSEEYSSSCDGTYTLFSWAYMTDGETSGWLYGEASTTRSLPFGSQLRLQVQCCWFDLIDCFGFSTICDFYGTPQACRCDPVVTWDLTADTCPGEDIVICE